MHMKPEDREREDDGSVDAPRQSFFASLPKRSFSRVILLLAALIGILYLQQKTGTIAGCMSSAFLAPLAPLPSHRTEPSIRARVEIPPTPELKVAR